MVAWRACERKRRPVTLEVGAALTVGADGRHSIVREKAGLEVIDPGRLSMFCGCGFRGRADDPDVTLGRFREGQILVTLNRGDYWQCAYIIPKNGFAEIQQRGLADFRQDILKVAPFLARARSGNKYVGRHQAVVSRGGLLEEVVAAGLVVYRRCGARDVASGRSRNQSGDPGCRGRGKYSGSAVAAGCGDRDDTAKGAAPARFSHSHDATAAGAGAQAAHRAGSGKQKAAENAAAPFSDAADVPGAEADSGEDSRAGFPAGTCAHA